MKIRYKVNKSLPDVQYLARIENMPMASFIDEHSIPTNYIKVVKERLDRPGILIEEEKEIKISRWKLAIYILFGMSMKDIIKIKNNDNYPHNIELLHD